jgi:hypothetical protein
MLLRNLMSKTTKIVLVVVIVYTIVMLSLMMIQFQKVGRNTELGLTAVKYMYNFASLEELNDNMQKLKELTTSEVYERLTIDNTDRALNVYLKFKNKPVIVVPEEATDRYVIYKLKTENISDYRKFVFFFSVDDSGKISKVRESEVVDFVDDNKLNY